VKERDMLRRTRRVIFGLAGAGLLLAAACNGPPPLPKTYPAVGTVFKGKEPMVGGSIQFVNKDDPLLLIVGDIGRDGKFKLRTVKDTQTAEGAPAGEYDVTVQPPAVEDKRGGVEGAHKHVPPIPLGTKYKVEARDNTFKIELP
jgi:hypothetical protein